MGEFAKFYNDGGPFMHAILVAGLLGSAAMLERLYYLIFKANANAAKLYQQVQKCVMSNNIDTAIKICDRNSQAALGRVLKAGLTKSAKDEQQVSQSIEESMLEVMPKIDKRVSMIAAIANVATLLGLLGTIFGMLAAFEAVANAPADQRSTALARGIGIAMNTTGFGLIVAIPLLASHIIVSNVAKSIKDNVELYSVKLENLLSARFRLG